MMQSLVASNRVMTLWRTVIGKKVVMAVTGVVLVGFVIAHMLGNLKIFSGPDVIDAYSRFLREVGMPELGYGQLLWLVRIVLLVCVTLHIIAAIQYGNLFDIYERITGEDAYTVPMRIYPAPHYTMGGLWVDYQLMSTIPGLFVGGEANFSDHGANRLGASALMQGLADGYFILPSTVPDYLASTALDPVDVSHSAFAATKAEVEKRIEALIAIKGKRSPDSFHRELGRVMWDECGMARSDAGLRKALARIPELREEFWHDLRIVGGHDELNQALEKANRVSDFLEIAELMCIDALHRTESCGGHFRVESQTPEGEAKRDDANFSYTAAWEWKGSDQAPALHKEPLTFEYVPLSQRSYK